MAADTPAKRRSAMLISMPFRGTAYPQASIDDEERAAVMFLYSGIPGAALGGGLFIKLVGMGGGLVAPSGLTGRHGGLVA